jgi:hypothetical protein
MGLSWGCAFTLGHTDPISRFCLSLLCSLRQRVPPFLDAPVGMAVVAFATVSGISTLKAWNSSVTQQAVDLYLSIATVSTGIGLLLHKFVLVNMPRHLHSHQPRHKIFTWTYYRELPVMLRYGLCDQVHMCILKGLTPGPTSVAARYSAPPRIDACLSLRLYASQDYIVVYQLLLTMPLQDQLRQTGIYLREA